MPVYEYTCKHCGHRYEVVLTIHEHEKAARPPCPKCHSHQVQQHPATFQAVTSSKASISPG